ncbi:MAG: hypothetical protein ACREVX_00375 [Clostridium sp.]|uniref:hypothetical protein n=1 Tax=Clostridium sp. TaxID=1506 RepID=UPI003D6CC7FD
MKDDKLVIAGVIGALSTIPSEIVTQILAKQIVVTICSRPTVGGGLYERSEFAK